MKKILVSLAVLATTAVLAACSAGTTSNAAVQPAAAASTSESSSVAPSTTVPAVSTTTTTAPTSSSSARTSASSSSAPKTTTSKPKPKPTTTAPPAAVPCAITDGACVDLSAKKAWLLQDGKVVYGPVPITSGRKGYPTPTGLFHVLSKEKVHYSKEFDNAPMPNSVFFYPGDAFHTGSLSTPSHGCIHLSSGASLKFFNTLRIGDPVQVVQ